MTENINKTPRNPFEENIYYASEGLAKCYLEVAQQLDVVGSVIVSPEKPMYAEKKIQILLDDEMKKVFFERVSQVRSEEGY